VPKLLNDGQEQEEGLNLLRLHRRHPPPVQVHGGLQCHHGRDHGVVSHSRDEKKEQTVNSQGPARSPKGAGTHQLDQTDGHGVFCLAWPHLHAQCPQQGSLHQCRLRKFLEHFDNKRPAMAQ
jgi:hypothetical protein